MKTYQLVEKRGGIDITAYTESSSFKLFKINDTSITDISEGSLQDIGYGYKRLNITAPDEDCYLCFVIDSRTFFIRVGNPNIRAFLYTGKVNETYKYKARNFNNVDDPSLYDFIELGNGIYATDKFPDVGDWILEVYKNSKLIYKPIPIHIPYIINNLNGKIVFEKNQWQLLAIPKDIRIYDVIKSIEEKYNVRGEDIFDIFNAYPSNSVFNRRYLSFIPGFTEINSDNNFKLIYRSDDGSVEITGFWVKTKNYDGELITYEW